MLHATPPGVLLLGFAFAAQLSIGCIAGTTTTVVDLPTRGVIQRILYIRPERPVANIVFLPGQVGILDIAADGTIPGIPGRCAPMARNRDALAARGLAVALVDRATDLKVRQYDDIRTVVRYMRSQDDVPTWIVGGSGSTAAALTFAADFPAVEPLGLIVFSPARPDLAKASLVTRPTLIIYHQADVLTLPFIDPLFEALKLAPVKEREGLVGGSSEGCGHHLFAGVEAEFVAAVARFIGKYPPGQALR
jgi:pimeloyl-ACP methyl ester carboxylesterase